MKVDSLVKQGEEKTRELEIGKSLQGPERLVNTDVSKHRAVDQLRKTGRRKEGNSIMGASFMATHR